MPTKGPRDKARPVVGDEKRLLRQRAATVRPRCAPPLADVVATLVLERLDAVWNAADGAAFAREFTSDADVVNIFGGYFHGSAAIAERMQAIFDTIFKGSVHRSRTLEVVRYLDDGIIVAVSSSKVDVPAGPQAPQIQNRQTLILVNEAGAWKIRHWHNTPIRNEP